MARACVVPQDLGCQEDMEEEGRPSVGRKSPKMPTKVKMEEHSRTQFPYRSWCQHCVMSRARNSHNRRRVEDDKLEELKVLRVHLDFLFMAREDEKASANPLPVMADERTGSRCARATGKKGLGEHGEMDWLIEDISNTLKGR